MCLAIQPAFGYNKHYKNDGAHGNDEPFKTDILLSAAPENTSILDEYTGSVQALHRRLVDMHVERRRRRGRNAWRLRTAYG